MQLGEILKGGMDDEQETDMGSFASDLEGIYTSLSAPLGCDRKEIRPRSTFLVPVDTCPYLHAGPYLC